MSVLTSFRSNEPTGVHEFPTMKKCPDDNEGQGNSFSRLDLVPRIALMMFYRYKEQLLAMEKV